MYHAMKSFLITYDFLNVNVQIFYNFEFYFFYFHDLLNFSRSISRSHFFFVEFRRVSCRKKHFRRFNRSFFYNINFVFEFQFSKRRK